MDPLPEFVLNEGEAFLVFRRMCLIRHFELNVAKAYNAKLIKCPIYLSVGQEAIAAALSVVYPNPFIFAQHRAHDLYIAYGGDLRALRDELLHLSTGCARGMGGSASIHCPEIGMFGHDGHMGTQIPIAVGFALKEDLGNRKILAVMGDASAEEDYVLAALGWAKFKKLPILFVCADNGLSILTKVEVRRDWKIADVARGFGMEARDTGDVPWLIMREARDLSRNLPALLNIHTVRHLWHAGAGCDGKPERDRLGYAAANLVKLFSFFSNNEVEKIEKSAKLEADSIWDERFREMGVECGRA